MKKITKKTKLAEILKKEKAKEILAKHRLPCLGCQFLTMEMEKLSLEKVCELYGINLEALLEELNKDPKRK